MRVNPYLNSMRCLLLRFFLAVFPGISAGALDFGLLISQSPDWGTAGSFANSSGDTKKAEWNYTGTYSPWFSAEWGKTAKLYISARVGTACEQGEWKPEDAPVLVELGRTEFSWRPAARVFLEAGRIHFGDPSGIIAAGLFDGLNGSAVFGKVRLSMGAFYTGLLYKETAGIVMSSGDAERYVLPPDYGDSDTWFASRRVLASVTGEFADLTPRTSLTLNALAQFDVNGGEYSGEYRLHTQYLTARYGVRLLETLGLTGTAVVGLAENRENEGLFHFAAALEMDWETPGSLRDMVQMEFRWSSGEVNDRIRPFMPLNASVQGQVFTPKLSALMTAKGKYTARLHRNFSAAAEGTYFIRTDGKTLSGAEYPPSDNRLLGGELYGMLVWAPVSDLMLRVGGGAFFPGVGNVFTAEAPVRWKISAGIVLSL
jgi:hypothetical protein